MKRTFVFTLFFSLLTFFYSPLFAFTGILTDTCAVNDICETAIPIDNVQPEVGFVCVDGCTIGASPEVFNNQCHVGFYPTVWYRVLPLNGSLMNIHVSSDDMDSPTITFFQMLSDCNDLIQIPLTNANLPCVVGQNGVAEAIGTDIGSNVNYFIAVSSLDNQGGTFSLCVSTVSISSLCVTDRELKIVARSAGGDLNGPFYPGEVVSVCMNVNSYTAAGNGCQWFQGLVPVFGNGWDPVSFDPNGQPLNATVNGNPMGIPQNGLYMEATWDWFADVDYHYRNNFMQVGDMDGNGTLDMCNTAYENDCPDLGGLDEACCGPCWGAPLGTILPPGWFAYGINGSCATPGPPVRVDWGDGNTCGGGMGPWQFCFDLMVRSYPDCTTDETTSDLSLGFFTFSDGETGSWTGSISVCALDQPVKVRYAMQCNQVTDLGMEDGGVLCAGNVFEYSIDEPDVEDWTWSIFPSWAIPHSPKAGANGFTIADTLIHLLSEPVDVTYFFTGQLQGSANTVIKQVRFTIIPGIESALPNVVHLCERDKDSIVISAAPLSGGQPPFQFLWQPGGITTPEITLYPPFQNSTYTLAINDSIGCNYQAEMKIQVRPCQLDTIIHTDDESNDGHTFEDPPPMPVQGGKIIYTEDGLQSPPGIHSIGLKIYPQPTSDVINIDWTAMADDADELMMVDTKGSVVYRSRLSPSDRKEHRVQVYTSHLGSGVYIVLLRTDRSMVSGRMVLLK